MKVRLLLPLLLLLSFSVTALEAVAGQAMSAGGVVSSGAVNAASGQYALAGTLGQSAIGRAASANYAACYGYWCANVTVYNGVPPQRIYLPLVLRNYDPALDAYEPDGTYQQAKPISADGSLQHRNFYPAGDVDWARLEVGPGTYIIATSGLAQGNTYPDTVMALYASNGVTQLANNDDCSLTTRASCITWTTSTSSTLYIKVWPYDANSVGPNSWYDLSVVKQ